MAQRLTERHHDRTAAKRKPASARGPVASEPPVFAYLRQHRVKRWVSLRSVHPTWTRAAPHKRVLQCGQLRARCSLLRIGAIRRHIVVSDRLVELARREVVSLPIDPVVEMIAGRQRRLEQFAAEEVVDQQRSDVALPAAGLPAAHWFDVEDDHALRSAPRTPSGSNPIDILTQAARDFGFFGIAVMPLFCPTSQSVPPIGWARAT
ncbi:hypothetical protein G8O24_04530 [Bradyrhizobium sp. INPA01-394B]|uniref:Uncharacterized protein n=1 Tax=Bradyrhizobium campsiandrae TaxID=1729892 RepID=A0ABR7U8X6_9BRAD|nr:hypothetical protein [Bradyrhizobium campsiandrae]MBC9876616.1 hypothetical protein [Bradyrhizobium campsiandrae]MBC9979872.1 hypothetical protein [Bradyrhizobium campsiandrae]